MSCYSCACNLCARNCELPSKYFTPGEIGSEAICFSCDDCYWYGHDQTKRSQYRKECEGHIEPAKVAELHAKLVEARARRMRAQIKLIK